MLGKGILSRVSLFSSARSEEISSLPYFFQLYLSISCSVTGKKPDALARPLIKASRAGIKVWPILIAAISILFSWVPFQPASSSSFRAELSNYAGVATKFTIGTMAMPIAQPRLVLAVFWSSLLRFL